MRGFPYKYNLLTEKGPQTRLFLPRQKPAVVDGSAIIGRRRPVESLAMQRFLRLER